MSWADVGPGARQHASSTQTLRPTDLPIATTPQPGFDSLMRLSVVRAGERFATSIVILSINFARFVRDPSVRRERGVESVHGKWTMYGDEHKSVGATAGTS